MKDKVTMKDISDIVGVSKVTVSKVFNNRNDISEQLREKILKVADDLGYRYNPGIKTLKTGITNNIGVLVSQVFLERDENFYSNIFKKIYISAIEEDYNVILTVINNTQESNCELPIICKEHKIDGLVILGQIAEFYIQEIMKYGFPIVLVDFTYRNLELDSVVTNNFEASYFATNYLISKNHHNIGFVGNIKNTKSIMDRYLGFCKALFEHDLEVDEDFIIKDRDDNKNEIDYDIPKNLPTAFVCNSDKAAYVLIKKLKTNGYNIPDDCSIMGFDDVTHSIFSEPKITTMRVRKEEMADFSVKQILKRLKNKNTNVNKIIIDTDLIERDSVKSI